MISAVESIKSQVENFIKAKSGGVKFSAIEREFGSEASLALKLLIDEGVVRNVYTHNYGWVYYFKGK
ncbi:MAG: hypothetical protein HQK91_02685 [Nitrospirae bacterium]|nr:hypothetical protein [Nitrospirota bacterium]MBF0540341.1 hypothetical protein [Nitrospirota bacterium]